MLTRINLLAFLLFATILSGQTPGLIVDPSTATLPKVLDPDGNGYVSGAATGFVSNDQTESEIVFSPMVFVSTEPTSDLGPGPDCGFTDFVDSGAEDPVMYKSTATDLIFRFRIGSALNNSKGYSVMIDLDQKFGLTGPNADPEATINNPGFEVEFNLQTNFGVYMYNVNSGCPGSPAVSYDGHTNYQKSMALTTNCADPDYFYDFYFKWSDITAAYPGFTNLNTARMVTMTQMNPQPAICNNALSDFGGIDDNACGGVPVNCWGDLIDAYTTQCPTFTTPVAGASTITGTSPTANAVINVYRNGSLLGTVTATGNSWTLSSISPLIASNDVLYATATLAPRIASPASCNTVTVGATCTAALVSSGVTGNSKGICGAIGTGINGAQIFLYDYTLTLIPGPVSVFAIADGSFQWKCNTSNAGCNSGAGCLADGAYAVTQKSGSQCESQPVWICIGNSVATSATPVITTTPVLNTTTAISGTAISGAKIILYVNGIQKGTATSTGTWTVSSLTLVNTDVVTIYAVESGKCISLAASVTVQQNTMAPQVTGTYCSSTPVTSVTGISSEAAGTVIQVYENNIAEGSTTTVSATGTWTATTGINIAIGSVITARATATGQLQSAVSNSVTVFAKTTSIPVISTATIVEGASTLTGTGTSGNIVGLYVDGILSTTTTVPVSGTWTFTGLAAYVFYTGGVVTVSETSPGGCAGTASASKTVVCANPSSSLSVDPASATVCLNATAAVTVYLSESGVIYQLYNGASTSGASQIGTGGTITLTSAALATSATLTVKAIRLSTTCSSFLTDNVPVTVNTISPLTLGSNTPVCIGNDINLTANTIAGTYSWTGPDGFTSSSEDPTITTATAAMAGTYSATITVGGCTSPVATTTVVVNSTIPSTPSPGSNTPVCTGNTINLSTAAVAGATYSWTGPDAFSSALQNPTRAVATAAMAGTYSVTVTVNGCTSAAGTTAVVINTTPSTPSPGSNTPVCTGNTINLSTAAVAGATYSWTGPDAFSSALQNPTRAVATSAMAGTYSVTVTVNGCTSAAGTTTVVINTTPSTPSPGSNTPVCTGNTINLSTAAVAGATYSWTGPDGFSSATQNPSITNSTSAMAGTYSVTITTDGCTSAAGTTAVVINTTPSTPSPGSNTPVCTGNTINLSTAAVAGATYSWTGPDAFSSALQNPTRAVATSAMAGTYSVTVTTNGCTSAAGTTAVVINTTPSTPSPGSNTPVCTGNTINLSTAAVAGATYSWTGPDGFSSATQNPSITNSTSAMAGTYSVTITTNGCTSTSGTTAVVINTTPSTPSPGSNTPVCTGNTINLSTAAVAGTTYSWTGPDGFSSAAQNPSITNSTSAMAGTYSVTITTDGCISAAGTTAVVINTTPSALTLSSNSPVCIGNDINLTANTIAGTYSWTGPDGFTSSSEDPTISSSTLAMDGTYSATITVGGCTSPVATTTVVVSPPPSMLTLGSNSPVCVGNDINLTANTVAGTYSWTGPDGFTSSSEDPTISSSTVAMAGTYSATVTVGTCTSPVATTTVVINTTPSTPSPGSNTPVCTGNTINLSTAAVAGATYSWTGPDAFSSALQNPTRAVATAAMAGTYSVTVTVNGCTSAAGTTAVVVNTTPSTPSPGSNTPVCTGNTINLSTAAVAGATYSWTGPDGFSSATQNPSITNSTSAMAGTYSVTITTDGCTSAAGTTAVVINTTPSTPSPGSNTPVCTGNTINLSTAAVAGATYSWTGPDAFSSALQNPTRAVATSAMAGTYSVTVTTNGCTSAAGTTAVVINTTPSTPSPGSNTPVCTGNTINLSTAAVAGATYSWTGPDGFSSAAQNPSITNSTSAMAGTYSVTITTNGCTSTSGTTAVVINTTPSALILSSNSPVCIGNDINLTSNTVAGTYSWTGPDGFTSSSEDPTISSSTLAMDGTYSATVTASGCTSPVATTIVVVSSPPSMLTLGSNSPVCVGNDINLTANTVAGTYSWTGPDGFTSSSEDPTISSSTLAMAGTYSATVTVGTCTSPVATTTVVINTIPTTPTASSNSPVCTGNTINLSIPAVAGATYSWTGPDAFSSALQNPARAVATTAMAGTYSVTVTVNGCTSAAGTTSVVINTTPSAPSPGSNTPVCTGNTINLSTAAVAGATYSWTGPDAFSSALQNPTRTVATSAMAGTYSVTVTTNGCTSAAGTTAVVINTTPSALTLGSNSPVCIGNDINLTSNTIAGTYSWTGPDGFTSSSEDPAISSSTLAMAGTYSATVTDNGCTSPVATTTVVVNATPSALTLSSNTPVCTGNNIDLTSSTVVGTYAWTGPDGFTSSSEDPTISSSTLAMAGTYSATVTVNGCVSPVATTTVVMNVTPSALTLSSNTPVCTGNNIDLTSNTVAGTYAWTGPDGFTSSSEDPTISSSTTAMAGTYSATVTENGCSSPVATTTVVVNSRPAAPTATSNSPLCAGGTINLFASTIPSATYSWSGPSGYSASTQNPLIGSATAAMSGTYTVFASLNGCAGPSASTVVIVDCPPVTVNQSYSTNEDAVLTVTTGTGILSNGDADPESFAITLNTTPVSGPLLGMIVINTDGSFVYTPNANANGIDTIVVSICDPGMSCNNDTIFITVTPVNDAPVVDNELHAVLEDTPVTGDLIDGGDSDPDGTLLTPNLTLVVPPANGSILINTDGTYTYTPNANFNGSELIVVSICDAGIPGIACTNDTIRITLAPVNDAPVTVVNAVTTPFNTAISVNPNSNNTDVDGNLDPTKVTIINPANNGTTSINASTGVVTYVPNAAYQGVDTVVVSVCDDGSPLPVACSNDTIIVVVNSAVLNTSPLTVNEVIVINEDVSFTTTVATGILSNGDTDPDGTTLSVYPYPVVLPQNGTVTINTDGSYTYTPNANFNGSDSFVVAVCDNGLPLPSACTNDTVRFTVTAVNDVPLIINNVVNTPTGTVVTIDPNNNNIDVEGPLNPGSVTLVNIPTNGTVSIDPGTGVITFTPNTGYSGTEVIVVQVCDQGLPLPAICGNDTIRVTVSPSGMNTPPNTRNENYVPLEDNVLTVSAGTGILSNGDVDPDGTTLTVTTTPVVFPSKGSVVINTDGSFVYTPFANENGDDYFVVSVCDAGTPMPSACSNDTVRIAITPVNDAPNVVNNTIFTATNTVVYIDPNNNNIDTEGPMNPSSVALVDGPSQGTISINPVTGVITYIPFAGSTGVDTVIVNVCDSGSPLPAQCQNDTIFLRTYPVTQNTPPNTVNEYLTVSEDNILSVSAGSGILSNGDLDPDGTTLSLTVTPVVNPANGVVVVQTDGSFVYTPNANFNGTDYFVVSICDLGTPTPSACRNDTVFLSIAPVNDAPVIQNETANTPLNTVLNGSIATNDSEIDGTTLVYNTVPLFGPQYGTFTIDQTGTYTYTPSLNYTGVDTIIIRVCDIGIPAPGLCTNDTLRIFTGNLAPVAINDTSSTTSTSTSGEPVFINVTLNDTDPEGQLNIASVDLNPSASGIQNTLVLPGQGTVSVSNAGVVIFTPEAGFTGFVDIPYTIADNSGQTSNIAIIHIVVTEGSTLVTIQGGITPNGDGINDVFVIQGASGIIKLQIYNRWGNIVYGSNDYQNDWSGTVNGMQDENERTKVNAWGNNSKLPDGTYFYVIEIADMNFKKAGYLELKR